MKISVIIPIYNLEKEIINALESIASQNFEKSEYEIITVLDSCTDKTEEVVKKWHEKNKDINLVLLSANCLSPGGARNVGLDNAKGEYIIFVDGDDTIINKDAFKIVVNAIKNHNALRVTDHEINGNHIKFSNRLTIWLHIFRRDLIGSDRFTDMLLNEDYEFVKRIRSKNEYNEAVVDIPLYCYNYNNDRMVKRIKDVRKISFERRKKGLSSLYISDEFDNGWDRKIPKAFVKKNI